MRLHRTLYLLPLTVFAILLTTLAHADFQDGLAAYDRDDYSTAFKEWLPLAEQGHAELQHNLGVIYRNGLGVPQDNEEALRWYHLAAEQGYAPAQHNLGVLYYYGEGVAQSIVLAHMWFNLAARQNVERAAMLGKTWLKA